MEEATSKNSDKAETTKELETTKESPKVDNKSKINDIVTDNSETTNLVNNHLHDTALFNSCYDTIKGWLKKDEVLDSQNILAFTVKIIKLVESATREKGAYKKQLVIDLTKCLVKEMSYPDPQTKQTVLALIDSTLPGFIDITISVATGEVNLGKKCKKFKKWCCLII